MRTSRAVLASVCAALTPRRGRRPGVVGALLPAAPPPDPRAPAPGCPAPTSRVFGLDRGRPIDRYYIERFLAAHAGDIRGRVLEVGDDNYTRRFGGARVKRSDVLHVKPDPHATIVADLCAADDVPAAIFDALILTQTLPFIFDVRAALRHVRRMLRPGGVLLLTVPGISQISRYDAERWGDYWRFTPQSVLRLLAEQFAGEAISVRSHGNVRVAAAFLDGLALEELPAEVLETDDLDYPVIITARAVRTTSGPGAAGS
jgi:SAM-dependent methyltransferase